MFAKHPYQIHLSVDEIETIVAFIKMHERVAIPDDVWELCMKLIYLLEE